VIEQQKPIEPPQDQPAPRWQAESLSNALKVRRGIPLQPKPDNSPNRGSGWMAGK
jgi:hypothetical protein